MKVVAKVVLAPGAPVCQLDPSACSTPPHLRRTGWLVDLDPETPDAETVSVPANDPFQPPLKRHVPTALVTARSYNAWSPPLTIGHQGFEVP